MTGTGEELVKEIRRDLLCPQCEYNLRGLYGDIVWCPECGATCDVAKLVSLRWTKPWHQAPGLSTVFLPTAWAVLGAVGGPMASRVDPVLLAGCLLVWLAVWLWLLWRAWDLFQSVEGVYVALASHVILAGYVFGVWGSLALVFHLLSLLGAPPSLGYAPWQWFALAFCLAPLGLLVWACHRAERFVARRCIRRYLARMGVG